MPVNIWDRPKYREWLPPEALRQRKQRERANMEQRDRMRQHRDLQDYTLKLWGYKPWRRHDGRNRPLRTKTSGISFRARMREHDIVKLRCAQGLTFRQIGERLGISHVAAWKRYEWFTESARLEEAYRAKCLREIEWKMNEMERLAPRLSHLPSDERNRVHVSLGLVPAK